MASVLAAGFLDFELYDHFLPHRRAQYAQFYRFMLMRLRQLFSGPVYRFIVAETVTVLRHNASVADSSSGPAENNSIPKLSIVGFAVWEAMGSNNPLADLWRSEGYDADGGPGRSWRRLPHALTAAIEGPLLGLEYMYVKMFLNKVCDHVTLRHMISLLHHNFDALSAALHLQFLCIHPGYQGGGVGGILLDWGLRLARQWTLPTVLESSLAGYRFYERNGFKAVLMVRIGGGDVDGEELEAANGTEKQNGQASHATRHGAKSYDMPVMVWEPEGHEGQWVESDGKGGWKLRDGVGTLHVNEGEEEVVN